MKALRALSVAVAVMTVAVLAFLFSISSPRVVVVHEQLYEFEEEQDSPSLPPLTSLHTSTSKSPDTPITQSLSTRSSQSTSLATSQSTTFPPPPTPHSVSSSSSVPSTDTTGQVSPSLHDDEMVGHLNYDIWRHPVGHVVDDLRIKRDFPSQPEVRGTIDRLQTSFSAVDKDSLVNRYGHKIYGYLLPKKSGSYQLRARLTHVTAACGVEVWLSSGSSPLTTRLVVSVQTPLLGRNQRAEVERTEDSDVIQLDQRTYYFEFLEKAFDGQCVATILWKEPGATTFTEIPPNQFAMAVKLSESSYEEGWAIAKQLLKPLPSNQLQSHMRVEYVGDTVYHISELDVLEPCQFTSRVAFPHKLRKEYEGVYQIKESFVSPEDETRFMNWRKKDRGSKYISHEKKDRVLLMYQKAFSEKGYKGEVKVHMMEETLNREAGSRYLLELAVGKEGQSNVTHTSEYVYLPAGASTPCHTANFQWKKDVDVHIVVSVKNLGLWIQHLIHNMEHIYKVTRDQHFELIIADYNSADLDVEAELRASSLPRWKVISLSGGFSRSGGLQAGIDYVTDPDSIVMTIDMHLTLPPGFVEYVRRHVVQGKMGFAPMFFRLNQGYTEININGFWETLTYGLLGMYKSDWVMTGGFDTQKYTTKWGGEDWDAVDKVVSSGIELFRIRYPGLVHYYHTRTGMWQSAKNRQ